MTMNSAGSWRLIIAGMPAGMQKVEGQLPGPPDLRSAVMASNTFWYSGVSGAGPASSRQLLGLPLRTHWPPRSGYFPKSTTWAAAGSAGSTRASARARTELRSRLWLRIGGILLGSTGRRQARAIGLVGGKIHRSPATVEAHPCACPRAANRHNQPRGCHPVDSTLADLDPHARFVRPQARRPRRL